MKMNNIWLELINNGFYLFGLRVSKSQLAFVIKANTGHEMKSEVMVYSFSLSFFGGGARDNCHRMILAELET